MLTVSQPSESKSPAIGTSPGMPKKNAATTPPPPRRCHRPADGSTNPPVAGNCVTVTVNVASPTPAASDAEHVTVVTPTANNEPDGGTQVGPDTTPTSSVAVAAGDVTTH